LRYNCVLLFGPPGAGKGTQGAILSRVPGIIHVACGQVFRGLTIDNDLGKVFLDYSSKGELVPEHLTVELWERHIKHLASSERFDPKNNLLVLDGIPRTLQQAKLMVGKINVLKVIHLVCQDESTLIERIRIRALHEGRLDDASDAVIKKRLDVYRAQTQETLSFYPSDIITEVDASRSPLRILADIALIIDSVSSRVLTGVN
jgi:adenylate kinase